jgi:hypothetical protein
LLDGLARHLLLALPGWLPAGDETDNWGKGHRGLLAQRLVEQLSERNPRTGRDEAAVSLWRKVRRRLRG